MTSPGRTHVSPDIRAVALRLNERAEELGRMLFPAARLDAGELVVGSLDGEPGRSLRLTLRGEHRGLWCEHATGAGGDMLDLVAAKTPGDAIASYAHLEKALGAEKLALPPKDKDGGRDFSAWDGWSRLGRPETPDDYRFEPIDGREFSAADQAFHAALRPALHKAGLAPWQLAELNAAFNGYTRSLEERSDRAAAADRAALEKDWGGDFETQIALADRVVRLAFGDDLDDARRIRLADGRFLLDDARLARAFDRVGALIGEDGALVEGAARPGLPATPAAARAEIDRIRGEAHENPKHAYNDRNHPEHRALHERVLELYRIAEPSGTTRGA
jgi:hypothetical protein